MSRNNLIQFRKGTLSEFNSVNPVLASGEPGYAIDSNLLKVGDGLTPWSGLLGFSVGSGISSLNGLTAPALVIDGGHNIGVTTSGTEIISISYTGVDHVAIPGISDVNNSNNTFIQDLLFDQFGHVTGVASVAVTGIGGGSVPSNVLVSGDNISFLTNDIGYDTIPQYTLGAASPNHYLFSGPGLSVSTPDPTLYLVRGRTYKFTNNMGAHPFQFQSTAGMGGTAYTSGIDNSPISNTTMTWEVRHDTPNILYYQCTSHANMNGTVYILDIDSIPSNVLVSGDNISLLTNDAGYATTGELTSVSGYLQGQIDSIPSDTNTFVSGIVYNTGVRDLVLTRNDGVLLTGDFSSVLHSGDNISLLNNNLGYITGFTETISSGDPISFLVNDVPYAISGTHIAITNAASDVNNSSNDFVQDLLFDEFGHVTGVVSQTVTDVDTFIDGSGTTNYLPVFSGSDTLTNSIINQSGNTIGINTPAHGSSITQWVKNIGANGSWIINESIASGYPVVFEARENGTRLGAMYSYGTAYTGGSFASIGSGGVAFSNITGPVAIGPLIASKDLIFGGGSDQYAKMTNTEFRINHDGLNRDFRVEGVSDENLLFVDASTDKVAIGSNNPATKLHIRESGTYSSENTYAVKISDGLDPETHGMLLGVDPANDIVSIQGVDPGTHWNRNLSLQAMGGNVGIGTVTPAHKLDVSGMGRFVHADGMCGIQVEDSGGSGVHIGDCAYSHGPGYAGMKHSNHTGSKEFMIMSQGANTYLTGGSGYGVIINGNPAGGYASSEIRVYDATAGNDGVVINEQGQDIDTRIEGLNDENLFKVDASTDHIGIGTAVPAYKLDVDGSGRFRCAPTGLGLAVVNAENSGLLFGEIAYQSYGGSYAGDLYTGMTHTALDGGAEYIILSKGDHTFMSAKDGYASIIRGGNNNQTYQLLVNSFMFSVGQYSEKMKFDSSKVQFNLNNENLDFAVHGDALNNVLYVDASVDRVGIGTDSPATALHIVASGGEGTVISRTVDADSWAGLLIRNSQDQNVASFQYGNSGVSHTPSLQNTVLVGSRQSGIPVKFYQGAELDGAFRHNNERIIFDSDGNTILTAASGQFVEVSGTTFLVHSNKDAPTGSHVSLINVSGTYTLAAGQNNLSDDYLADHTQVNVVNNGVLYRAKAHQTDFNISATGTVNAVYGYDTSMEVSSATTLVGHRTTINSTGNVGNVYGIWLQTLPTGTTATYGIYENNSHADNYFAGNVGIGNSSPSHKLDVTGMGRFVHADGVCGLMVEDTGGSGVHIGDCAYSDGDAYAGMKHSNHTGGQEYMIISAGYATVVSSKTGYSTYIRAGGNATTYQTIIGPTAWGVGPNANRLRVDSQSVLVNNGMGNYDFKVYGENNPIQLIHADAALNRVGIGETSPAYKLDVSGTFSADSVNVNNAYTFPTVDGTAGHSLVTDGAGNIIFSGVTGGGVGGGITGVVEDTAPRLGGGLILNGNNIIGTGNINIAGSIDATSATFSDGAGAFTFSRLNSTTATWKELTGSIELVAGASTTPAITITNHTFTSPVVTINDDQINMDFRVEGDAEENLLYADASTDRVGIGTETPAYKLDVAGSGSFNALNINNAYTFPTSDGTAGHSLVTDGAGNIIFSGVTGGAGGGGDITAVTAGTGLSGGGTTGAVTLNAVSATISVTGIVKLTNTINSDQDKALTPKAVNDAGYLTAHPNITSVSSSDNSGRTYIQDILLDGNGHVTGIATATETVTDTDTTFSPGSGLSLSGTTFNAITATTDASGIVILTNTIDASQNKALTPKAVNDAGYLTAHPTITNAASSSDNSGRTYIQDIILDSHGHVTGVATATETVTDTNTTYTAGTGIVLGGGDNTVINVVDDVLLNTEIQAGSGINLVYDSGNGTLTINADRPSYIMSIMFG